MSGIPDADVPFCYLTTLGRRTGRRHEIEIWFVAEGRTLYLLAGGRHRADWVRNLRATPAVEVRVGRGRYGATARVVEPRTDEDALARRLLLAKYQAPGADDLERWGASALAVALDLSGKEPADDDVGPDAGDLEAVADDVKPGASVEVDGAHPGVGPQLAAAVVEDVDDARRQQGGADASPLD